MPGGVDAWHADAWRCLAVDTRQHRLYITDRSVSKTGIAMNRLLPPSLLLAAALLSACTRPAPPPEPVRAVRTMVVAAEGAGGSLDYAADVRARTESRLSFRVGGTMVRRMVDVGARVKAGDVLAQLDPQDLQLAQAAAQAAVRSAQVGADQAEADHARYVDLRLQHALERGG